MNLVNILKNVPQGTPLYSIVHGCVTFHSVDKDEIEYYPILCIDNKGCSITITKEGKNYKEYDGECILFPSKENRDWNTFVTDLPKLTMCFCFTEITSNRFIRLYNAKGEVFCDGYRSECTMGWNYIVPCDKYVLASDYFDPKDNYGKLSNKKW